MADKMMRVAGRNDNGVAKALRTNDVGSASVFDSVVELSSATINAAVDAKGSLKVVENTTTDSPYTRLLFRAEEEIDFAIRVVYGSSTNIYYEEYHKVENGSFKKYNFVEFKNKSREIRQIDIINQTTEPATIRTFALYGVAHTDVIKADVMSDFIKLNEFRSRESSGYSNPIWLYNQEKVLYTPVSSVEVNLALVEAGHFRLELWTYKGEGTNSFRLQDQKEFLSKATIQHTFFPRSPYHRIRLINLQQAPIIVDYANVQGRAFSDGLLGVDLDSQQKVPLSVEKDDNGNGVLRVVDAAPHGYDDFNGAYYVKPIDAKESNTKLFERTAVVLGGQELIFADGIDMSGYSRFYVTVKGDTGNYKLNIRRKADDGSYVATPESIDGVSNLSTEYMDVRAQVLRIDIQNNDTSEKQFAVRVMGVL